MPQSAVRTSLGSVSFEYSYACLPIFLLQSQCKVTCRRNRHSSLPHWLHSVYPGGSHRPSIKVHAVLLGNFSLCSDQTRPSFNNADDGHLAVNHGFHLGTSRLGRERCYTPSLESAGLVWTWRENGIVAQFHEEFYLRATRNRVPHSRVRYPPFNRLGRLTYPYLEALVHWLAL